MSFYAQYPASSSGANASVGSNGTPAPSSSTEVAGINPSGNLQPLQTDASGALITTPATGSVQHVIVDSSALPTGASTAALQTTGNSALGSILLDLTNGTQITQVTGTVPLPTGAATEATLSAFSAKTAGALVPEAFDYQAITYVPSGNGVGEIGVVTYYTGGSGGTLVATLTLAYDSNNRLSTVTKT